MNTPDPIRILTVDDHPILQEGLRTLIESQADLLLVAEASNGEEALRRFTEHRPDITLMDLRLPDMHGIDVIRSIRELEPAAKIIVLTTYMADVQVVRALKAGASAYLLKATLRRIFSLPFIRCTRESVLSRQKSLWRSHDMQAINFSLNVRVKC